jgi:hypothetical protein
MSAWFKTLFSLSLTHEYHGGACPDFDYLLPEPALQLARNARLLLKNRANRLYCVCEADAGGAPVKPPSGETLSIGLSLRNPHFSHFTEWELGDATALYRNRAAPAQLDAPVGVRLAGSLIRHEISKNSRPVTLSLVDGAGATLQTDEVSSLGVGHVSYQTGRLRDGGALTRGHYAVQETYAAATGVAHYYVEPEFLAAGVFGIVDIRLDAGFHAAAPEFTIAFTARKQKLRYYVVASRYVDADFAKLAISDQGFGEDKRAEVEFTRIAAGDFAADDLKPALMGGNGDKVTLFRSKAAHARQARARSKIQLKSNNDVLIQNLPAPPEGQALADLIIHVAKP